MTIDPAPAAPRSHPQPAPRSQPRPAAARPAVLVLHDVTKRYPNGKTALRDVDLVIPEGDFVFLVGPSGRRQVDPDQAAHPRRARDPRRGRRSTARTSPGCRAATCRSPAQDRHRLPGLQAAADEDRPRERRLRPRGHRHAAAPDPAGRRPGPRARRADRPGGASSRASCRAASSSGPRSPGPSSTTRA